jgi:hypothetical protein
MPQVVVIDAAASATATAVNENDSISVMFADVLRPLARLGVAVLLLHHHRKAPGAVGEQILGGMQWEGQIDRHLAFKAPSKTPESWSTPAGTTRASFAVKVVPGKARHGVAIDPIEFTIESEQEADGRYMSIALKRKDPGAGSVAAPDGVELIAKAIVEFLTGRPDHQAGLGEIVTDLNDRIESDQLDITVKNGDSLQTNNGRVTKALTRLTDRGLLTRAERGVYALVG